ncbi:MAG: hypothetical protein SGJ09_15115 [Phycisphaerae bacterium]|nr:hypothetical protein [Phycisphaerae bacterium]
MASLKLNGEVVHLKSQPLAEFQKLAQVLYARLKPEDHIRESVCRLLFDAMSNSVPLDSAVVQTTLWALSDLGVEELRVDVENKKVDVDKAVETDSSRGHSRALAVAAIESGRAYIAALANVTMRAIRLNGQIVRAFPQPKPEIEKVIQQIQTNRLVNEDVIFTAARAVGAYMKAGKTIEDPEFRAVVEVIAGLGVGELVVDLEQGKLALRSFNEHNATAMALLQGGNAKQVQQVRERIHKMTEKLAEAMKAAADGSPVEPAQAQRVAIPAVIGNPRTQRRRS